MRITGNTYTTGGKPQSYFTSFIDPTDLKLIFKNLSTQDMTMLENPSGTEPVGTSTAVLAAQKNIFTWVNPGRATPQSPIVLVGGANVAVAGTKPATNPNEALSTNPNEALSTNIFSPKPIANPNGATSTRSSAFDTKSTTSARGLFGIKADASLKTSAVPIAPTVDPALAESSKLSKSTTCTFSHRAKSLESSTCDNCSDSYPFSS
jgi:hypothetical protein